MSWIKAKERLPPEGEQILIHDDKNSRMVIGRYLKGRWYVESPRDGQLSRIEPVTHWAWVLDSYLNDDDD